MDLNDQKWRWKSLSKSLEWWQYCDMCRWSSNVAVRWGPDGFHFEKCMLKSRLKIVCKVSDLVINILKDQNNSNPIWILLNSELFQLWNLSDMLWQCSRQLTKNLGTLLWDYVQLWLSLRSNAAVKWQRRCLWEVSSKVVQCQNTDVLHYSVLFLIIGEQ